MTQNDNKKKDILKKKYIKSQNTQFNIASSSTLMIEKVPFITKFQPK